MGGGSSSGDNKVRYAEYFEAAHGDALNKAGADQVSQSVVAAFNAALGTSPYGDAADINVRDGFFSAGYQIESFPSLWDMYGKFMAGLDVHVLWEQTLTGINQAAPINEAIAAQADYLDDDINANVLPRFEAGMRNINAVQSSAFVTGRAIIEDSRVKAINKFASELRLKAVDASLDAWKYHLQWNESVIAMYSNMFKLYYSVELDVNAQDMDFQERDAVFDLQLYEYVRAMLGVVSGAQGTVTPPKPSQTQKALTGALGGAAAGTAISPGWGTVIGGVIGLAASFL